MASSSESLRDLDGRAFVVTGATSGIGLVTAGALAARGARVFLGCRSVAKGEAAAAALRATAPTRDLALDLLPVDVADLASVRTAAQAFVARGVPLQGLINNAGVGGAHGLSPDGFELTFATNHLGPYLLTRLLEPALRSGRPARVVVVSSEAHRNVRSVDFETLRSPTRSRTGLPEYAVSKLCNVLFARELGRRWATHGITSYSLHPGVVATGIWRRVPGPLRWLITRFMISPEEGARTTITCATSPELGAASGRYYRRAHEDAPSAVAQDDALAARLWDESERMVLPFLQPVEVSAAATPT
jgi:dehydrogenase/reductase SDR family protein 13